MRNAVSLRFEGSSMLGALSLVTRHCWARNGLDHVVERPVTMESYRGDNSQEGEEATGSGRPKCFVVVHNVAKRHNLGTLSRSATAFGVSEIILVGKKDYNAFGSHGATLHIGFRHFHNLSAARDYLKEQDCDICGVEIADGALPVDSHPFKRNTAFLVGNEGTGLSTKEMEMCDFFVYIPQYGPGTASLNVTVAASIVLHHFAVWAKFTERQREGQKFVVAERPGLRAPRVICSEDPEAIADRRRRKSESQSQEFVRFGPTIDEIGADQEGLGSATSTKTLAL